MHKTDIVRRRHLLTAAAREVERYAMGARIRTVVEGPNGAIWVLEDARGESTGRLLELTPKG